MKKLIMTLVAALIAVFTGCKSIPTPEIMEEKARPVGVAAGLVVTQNSKIDAVAKATIIEIVSEVSEKVPGTNDTFKTVWLPVATDYVQHSDKLTQEQKDAVLIGFSTVCDGIDFMFTVRYPKAKEHIDVMNAAVRGFTDGFLKMCRPPTMLATSTGSVLEEEYDIEAFNYLKSVK